MYTVKNEKLTFNKSQSFNLHSFFSLLNVCLAIWRISIKIHNALIGFPACASRVPRPIRVKNPNYSLYKKQERQSQLRFWRNPLPFSGFHQNWDSAEESECGRWRCVFQHRTAPIRLIKAPRKQLDLRLQTIKVNDRFCLWS